MGKVIQNNIEEPINENKNITITLIGIIVIILLIILYVIYLIKNNRSKGDNNINSIESKDISTATEKKDVPTKKKRVYKTKKKNEAK